MNILISQRELRLSKITLAQTHNITGNYTMRDHGKIQEIVDLFLSNLKITFTVLYFKCHGNVLVLESG